MFDEASEDALLLAAMRNLGAAGGSLGALAAGAVTGAPGTGGPGRRGGARGASLGYRLTKKDTGTQVVPLPLPLDEAARHVGAALSRAGHLLGTESRDDGFAARALVGVGLGDLNPTVVTAGLTPAGPSSTTLTLRAAGREGLIKQHPAAKALSKVTSELTAGQRASGGSRAGDASRE